MVKILAATDIHGSKAAVETLRRRIGELDPDILTVTGDITHFGPAGWAREFLGSFDIPLLAVNGNCDTPDVVALLRGMEELSLMDGSKEVAGLRFAGLAYPPRKTNFEGPVDVLLTHEPPRGCNDEVAPGTNIGSDLVKRVATKLKPRLLLSGHVHEARGVCTLGPTICVNPGPAGRGLAAVIEIGKEVKASLLSP